MKNILPLFGVLALITCFMMTNDVRAEEHAEDAVEGEVVEEENFHFVELNPLILPIITERGATQMVSLIVSVEVTSLNNVDKVKKYAPRLTDAFLSDLYGTFSEVSNANGGIVPIPYLKKRLNSLSDKVLGDDVVTDVLLQVLQKRTT